MILKDLAEALWTNAPDAMLLVDDAGVITLCNDAAVEMFGYAADELVGAHVELLVPLARRGTHKEKRTAYAAAPERRAMGSPLSSLMAATKSGEQIPVEISLSPVTVNGSRATIAIVRDVRSRAALEEELRHQSTHDALTGLHNRGYVQEELARLALSRRFPVAVIILDLDGLKIQNDTYGHAVGDRFLVDTARVMRSVARGDDVVARIGGDEFVILLPQTALDTAHQVLERLRRAADEHNQKTDGPAVRFSAGVGLAHEPAALAEALRLADDAMYQDKRTRRAGR